MFSFLTLHLSFESRSLLNLTFIHLYKPGAREPQGLPVPTSPVLGLKEHVTRDRTQVPTLVLWALYPPIHPPVSGSYLNKIPRDSMCAFK